MEDKPPRNLSKRRSNFRTAPSSAQRIDDRPPAPASEPVVRQGKGAQVGSLETVALDIEAWGQPIQEASDRATVPETRSRILIPREILGLSLPPERALDIAKNNLLATQIARQEEWVPQNKRKSAREHPSGLRRRRSFQALRNGILLGFTIATVAIVAWWVYTKSNVSRSTGSVSTDQNALSFPKPSASVRTAAHSPILAPTRPTQAASENANQGVTLPLISDSRTENVDGTPIRPPRNIVEQKPLPRSSPLELRSEQAAVEALIAGDAERAVGLYRKLAQERPDEPAYGAIATILQRRIDQRCKEQSTLGDKACNPSL